MEWLLNIIWVLGLIVIWFFFWLGLTHQWYYQDLKDSEVSDKEAPTKTWNIKLGDKLFGWFK